MAKITEVLRLHYERGLSVRQIAQATGLSKSSAGNYIRQAMNAGLEWPLPADMDETKLEALLDLGNSTVTPSKPLPDFAIIHNELMRKGVTLHLLWTEYQEQNPDGYAYTQFCEHYNRWKKSNKISMRQIHKAGEKMFLDFSGTGMDIKDKKTGQTWTAQMFVAVLGASSYVYAEAVRSQGLENWIMANINAFEYIGGVPELLVPDNLKSAVTVASRIEPDINKSYQEMARYYDTVVVPARVRKPKDKPKAEVEVKHLTTQIIAALRNRTFFDLDEANKAIRERLQEVNSKKFQKLDTSRKQLYEEIDKPALKPLPITRYEYKEWQSKKRVPEDYLIDVREHFYSVPYQHIGEMVEVCLTYTTVQVYLKGKRIAVHKRDDTPRGVSVIDEHRPKEHQAMAAWTSSQSLVRARDIGPNTVQLIEKIIANNHEEMAKRLSSGILKLEKEYPGRLEAAAARALRSNSSKPLTSVRSILQHGLDKLGLDEPNTTGTETVHVNVRGAKYYG